MPTNLSVLCRIVGQLGILTSAAATLAPYTTMLPDLGEMVAIAPPTVLAHGLADLLFVPAALLVCWASAQPWRQRLALGGCGLLACLLICQLALVQAMAGLNNLWGAGYLLATVVFPLGSVALLATSTAISTVSRAEWTGTPRSAWAGRGLFRSCLRSRW